MKNAGPSFWRDWEQNQTNRTVSCIKIFRSWWYIGDRDPVFQTNSDLLIQPQLWMTLADLEDGVIKNLKENTKQMKQRRIMPG